jgi:hypothetical protein
MLIKTGDILVMEDDQCFEVISGETDFNLMEGELTIVEVDEDNYRVGKPLELKITPSTRIFDIIR